MKKMKCESVCGYCGGRGYTSLCKTRENGDHYIEETTCGIYKGNSAMKRLFDTKEFWNLVGIYYQAHGEAEYIAEDIENFIDEAIKKYHKEAA